MQAIHPRFRSVSGDGGWWFRGLDRLAAAAGGVDDGGGGGVGGGHGGGVQAKEGHEREEAGSEHSAVETLAKPTSNIFGYIIKTLLSYGSWALRARRSRFGTFRCDARKTSLKYFWVYYKYSSVPYLGRF